MKVSRRNFLRSVGMGAAVAGLSGYGMSNPLAGSASVTDGNGCDEVTCNPTDKNSLFDNLCPCCPGEPLDEGEMRISFLGTSCIARRSQQGVSVYIEVGPTTWDPAYQAYVPADYAMFDCGMGVLANYIAMGIPYSRMDKIFLAHLHADHMSELSAIYTFGESSDRKSPLYVWGQSKSGWPDPVTGQIYDDGLKATLEHLREVWRWHTESFSFGNNSYNPYPPDPDKYPSRNPTCWGLPVAPVPVGPRYRVNPQGTPLGPRYADPLNDSYALVPIELDWQTIGGVAYDNQRTGLKITHFPAIHTRRGSLSYKLEWTPPGGDPKTDTISMIYSGDTKPNYTMLDQASGIDVLVHEIVMPPDQWARHVLGLPEGATIPQNLVDYMTEVQNSSHTTQAAFGYMLGQIQPPPRLTIATHFQAQDDTIACATNTINQYLADAYGSDQSKYPPYTFAADCMVFKVTKSDIKQFRAVVSDFAFAAPSQSLPDGAALVEPKYHNADGSGNPTAQIDTSNAIEPGDDTYDSSGYYFDQTTC